MSELAKKKCIPCSGGVPALKDDDITKLKKERMNLRFLLIDVVVSNQSLATLLRMQLNHLMHLMLYVMGDISAQLTQ